MRDGRYAPAAWLRFLDRSFRRSIEDIRSEPALRRSVLRQSVFLEGLALTVVLWDCRRPHGACHGVRRASRISTAVLLQQSFIALHLGMAQVSHDLPRFTTIGTGDFLTSLRGVCATLLLSSHTSDLPLVALLCSTGGVTDMLDGAVARRLGEQSRLGEMLDPAMDVYFYTAATLAAVQRGIVPRWFGRLVLARFLLPLAAGFYRYFRWAHPLDAKHTVWGKLAGILLTAVLLLAMLRPRAARRLYLPTSVFLTLAGVLQCVRALGAGDRAGEGLDRG